MRKKLIKRYKKLILCPQSPILEIVFLDHCSNDGWNKNENHDLLIVHTAGYLIHETEDNIQIAQSLAQSEDEPFGDIITIAKDLILSRKKLS